MTKKVYHSYNTELTNTSYVKYKWDDARPSSDERIMIELELNSLWSTCQRGRVASALVDNYGVVRVPARNGTPMNQPPCKVLGADPNERCIYCVHSERNVINMAAATGVSTKHQNLYTLKRPCISCANDIVQAQIDTVFYRWDYDTDGMKDYVLDMFRTNAVGLCQLEMTSLEISFHKMIEDWGQMNGILAHQ